MVRYPLSHSFKMSSIAVSSNQPFLVVFFRPPPQYWRGFEPCCDGRHRPGQPRVGRFFVLSSRPFSVSAGEDFAPDPATARVSGCLFVTEAAFTQATRLWNGLSIHDESNVPGDRRLGSVAHHLATLDAVVQVFCQQLVVLRNLLDGTVTGIARFLNFALLPHW
jgi:hypothetical protein